MLYVYVAVTDQRVLCPCNESWFTIADLEELLLIYIYI